MFAKTSPVGIGKGIEQQTAMAFKREQFKANRAVVEYVDRVGRECLKRWLTLAGASYATRLASCHLVEGYWDLQSRLLTEAAVVSLIQLGVLLAVSSLFNRVSKGGHAAAEEASQPPERLGWTATWLLLLVVGACAGVGWDLWRFQRIDLRFETIVARLVTPAVQNLGLCFWTGAAELRAATATVIDMLRKQPLLRAVFLLDAAALFVVWGAGGLASLGRGLAAGEFYAGMKSLLAGWAALNLARRGMVSRRERGLVLILGLALAAFSLECFAGWVDPVIESFFSNQPLLLRWLIVYGSLFAGMVAAPSLVSRKWRRRDAGAAAILGAAPVSAMTAATAICIDVYNSPQLTPSSQRLVGTCSLLAVVAVWTALRRMTQR